MTVSALWSALCYPSNGYTFSSDRTVAASATATSAGYSNAVIPAITNSGRYRCSFSIAGTLNQTVFGICDQSVVGLVNSNAENTTFNAAGAQLYAYGGSASMSSAGSVYASGLSFSNTQNQIDIVWDTGTGSGSSGTKQFWFRLTPSGSAPGNWNNNPSADPDTNTGGVACPYINDFVPFFYTFGGSFTFVVTAYTGQTAYPYTMPTTFADLPATFQVPVAPVAISGQPLTVEWLDGTAVTSGINYSQNGGAFVAASGFVAGTNGTVTTFTPSGSSFETVALQSNDNPLDQTQAYDVYPFTKPSGAGPLVAAFMQANITSANFPSLLTLPFGGGPADKVYYSILSKYNSGTVANGSVTFADADSTQMFQLILEYASPNTVLGYTGPRSATPTSGPGSVTGSGESISGFGTLDASSNSGTFAFGPADVSANGTVTTWDAQNWSSTLTLPFNSIILNPEPLFGSVDLAVAVWAGAEPETITLDSVSGTLGQTLSLAGEYAHAIPGGLNYSIDNGATFEPTNDFATTGSDTSGNWTASGGTITTVGTLKNIVQDNVTLTILSNELDLVVTEPVETLTLTIAAGVAGGLLEIGGVSNAGPAPSMNVSLNAGSTYSPVSGYSPGSGPVNAPFAGQGPVLAPGDYEVMVQDATDPSIVSNIIPLIVTSKGSGGGLGIGIIPNWSAADFLAAFQNLLPRGRAWPKFAAAVQTQVMAALMPALVRVCQSGAALLIDGYPPTTVQLIPEWESSLGLPDSCTPLATTIAQQQAAILQKFTSGGSQSIAYYIAVAALLGYDITITEQAADTFTWTVHAAAIAPPILFRAGGSRSGDLLELIVSNAQLECVLQRLKPAHTTLLFAYA